MWRWIACGVLVLASCNNHEQRAPAPGSAAVANAPVVADAAIDATPVKLEIACGPAMLAPRIPPPPKQKPPRHGAMDNDIEGMMGIGGWQGDGLIGQGGGASVNQTNDGLIGQGGGVSMNRTNDPGLGLGAVPAPAMVTFGHPTVKGSLDPAVIRRVLRRETHRAEYCYANALGHDPNLRGNATLVLTIKPDGSIANLKASGVAADCLNTAFASVLFPKSPDGELVFATETVTFSAVSQIGQTPAPKPKPKPVPPPPVMDTRSWTPFAASVGLASEDVATTAGEELVKVAPRAKLDACFAGKAASERVIVQVAFDGAVIGARSGGSGDAQTDSCIATSLIGLKVTAPPTVTELACDITRGDAPQPWRVVPESYSLIEVTPTEIREGGAALTKDQLVPQKGDGSRAFLIVADPKAPASLLAGAFERTAWSAATLVALKTDAGALKADAGALKAAAGAPVFIGLGRDGRTREPDYAPLLAISPDGDSMKSCAADAARGTAPKAETATLLATLASTCSPKPCAASLSIALGGTMQDLATYADAARQAGLGRLELSTTGCM